MSETKKLRVLVIADACNPDWTSVPLLGWSHTEALSKICDVHLVTHVRNKEAIEKAGWKETEHFTTIDTEKLAAPMYKLSLFLRGGNSLAWTLDTAIISLVYPYFEYLCWKKFKHALRAGDFDVVHRITPVSPTAPSPLAKRLKKIGVPYVVGPLNGGVPWPAQFRNLQRSEKEWLSYIRGAYKLLPGYLSLRRCASAIVAGSCSTKDELPEKYADKIFYLPENAIDRMRFSLKNNSKYDLPLKAAFVGRLVPYKGADMAIEAMEPLLKAGKMTYDIYGSGPEESFIKKLVADKGLEDSVTVHGFVANTELQKCLVDADVFVFPSVREFGGGVVLEAMALGVVPVIADYAGPAELVTESSGYKVRLGNREALINNFREQLERICEKPHQLIAKREASIERINRYYTWEVKAQQSLQIYQWLLGKASRPEFDKPFPD